MTYHVRMFDEGLQALRLREIDARLYASRGSLTVNQPGRVPPAVPFVPSRSSLGQYQ